MQLVKGTPMVMVINNVAYDGIDMTSNADGSRLSVTMEMSPEWGIRDLEAIFSTFSRLSHGTFPCRVFPSPLYDVEDLCDVEHRYDEKGRCHEGWYCKPQYEAPIPVTNPPGLRKSVIADEYGMWTPCNARELEARRLCIPYLYTRHKRAADGSLVFDERLLTYEDLLTQKMLDSITPDYAPDDEFGIYLVEELNSGLCLPLTQQSHVSWKCKRVGGTVVNSMRVQSIDSAREQEQNLAMVRELPRDAEDDRQFSIAMEIAFDEDMLERAMQGEDLCGEYAQAAERDDLLFSWTHED